MTTHELLQAAWERADMNMNSSDDFLVRREFALAKTAIEEAQMRHTRGMAMVKGCFAPADLEKN